MFFHQNPSCLPLSAPPPAQVSVISTSPSKRDEALSRLGADKFVVSKSDEDMKAAAGTLDGIIDTVSGKEKLPLLLLLLLLLLLSPPPPACPLPASAACQPRCLPAG